MRLRSHHGDSAAIMPRRFGWLLVWLAVLLSACSHMPREPEGKEAIDINLIPEPKPRFEPRSKYGNPESYVQNGKRYWVIPNPKGFVERGKASWYGAEFDGKRTSSGETYNMYDMTAAHRTLPLPTYIQVTNLRNNKKVIVRVNDRGPFAKDRILDLSYAAARKLGMVGEGTTPVEIRVLDPADYAPKSTPKTTVAKPRPVPLTTPAPVSEHPPGQAAGSKAQAVAETPAAATPGIYVQVGAYARKESADAVMQDVQEALQSPALIVPIESAIGILYRVRVGPFSSEKAARKVFPGLRDRGYFQYRIVRQ